jgi:hypothetical protein
MANFKINGVEIKNPTSFNIEYYTLTKSTRVASGDMVMDFVANKRKFNFGYAAIDAVELNKIIDLLWAQLVVTRQCFCTLTYIDDGVVKNAIVYSGSISKKLHRAAPTTAWVWKDVTFSLIER